MKRFKWQVSLTAVIIVLIALAALVQPASANQSRVVMAGTPAILARGSTAGDPGEQDNIKKTIRAYFDIRYQALSTLQIGDFGDLVSSAPEAESFLNSEMDKLTIEMEHARLNHLAYARYQYSLDFKNVTIDEPSQTASVTLTEQRDVVYQISMELDPANPIVSHAFGLVHTMALHKEDGQWKLVSDEYADYLWRLLRKTGKSAEEMLAVMQESPLPARRASLLQAEATCDALPDDDSFHDYNRGRAAEYATAHAAPENYESLNYDDFGNLGGDCTNFVSQAIYEGGNASMAYPSDGQGIGTSGWYYTDVNHRAAAWTDVGALYDFITHPGSWSEGPEGCTVDIEDIEAGDVIQYEWNDEVEGPDGDPVGWDHSVIVVAVSGGIPYVASHSPDVSNEPYNSLDYFGSYEDIRYIHIERIDINGPRGFDSNGIQASYYNDTPPGTVELEVPINWETFTDFVMSQFELDIAFNTGSSSPAPGVNGTFWSARWEGTLHVQETGNYTFYLKNLDDGGRIYVNNMDTPVVESWRVQGFHVYTSAPGSLDAGPNNIRVEFAQGPAADGGLVVEWGRENAFREKIGPYSGVTSTPTPTPTETSTPTPPTPTPPTPTPTTATPTETHPTPTSTPPTPKPCCLLDWLFGRCPDSSARSMASKVETTTSAVDDLQLFYQLRDEVLAKTPEGQNLIDLYYQHGPEVIALLQSDSTLEAEARTLLQLWRPNLQALVDGRGSRSVITARQINATKKFVSHLSDLAGPELKQAIAEQLDQHPLDRLVNKTMDEAWSQANGYQLTWRSPLGKANPYIVKHGHHFVPVRFTLTDVSGHFTIDKSVWLQLLDKSGRVVIGPVRLGHNPLRGIVVQGRQYLYFLETRGLKPGTYTLQVFFNSADPDRPATWKIQVNPK